MSPPSLSCSSVIMSTGQQSCSSILSCCFPSPITHVCCIGAGYVGGPSSIVLADKCPEITVTVVDIDQERINRWSNETIHLPVFEPGLVEIVKKCRGRNLFFSTDIEKCINDAQLIFVCVNTPTKQQGIGAGMAADLRYIEAATRTILKSATSNKIIVEKSTVPCKTAEKMESILNSSQNEDIHFEILSNPEFLAEGNAINDLVNPDRVIIGCKNTREGLEAQSILADIYAHWISKDRIILTNLWSSELSKLAANAMLAQRISSINALTQLCESTGADIDEVASAIGKDSRIGPHFLKASIGFGGSCFRKDISSLVYISESLNLKEVADYWRQVIEINEHQKKRFIKRIIESMFNTISMKKIVIYGFAFKKNTGDTRETPALTIVQNLLIENARVFVYDPVVEKSQIMDDVNMLGLDKNENLFISHDPYEAIKDADAIIICTEWDEFRELDYERIYKEMRKPSFIFDGRLILNPDRLRKIGFRVETIGKASPPNNIQILPFNSSFYHLDNGNDGEKSSFTNLSRSFCFSST